MDDCLRTSPSKVSFGWSGRLCQGGEFVAARRGGERATEKERNKNKKKIKSKEKKSQVVVEESNKDEEIYAEKERGREKQWWISWSRITKIAFSFSKTSLCSYSTSPSRLVVSSL